MKLLKHEQTEPVGEAADEGCRNLMLGWRRWLIYPPEKPDWKIRYYLLTIINIIVIIIIIIIFFIFIIIHFMGFFALASTTPAG